MDVSPPLFGNSVLNCPWLHFEYSFLPHDSYLLKAGKILWKNQNQKSNNVKKIQQLLLLSHGWVNDFLDIFPKRNRDWDKDQKMRLVLLIDPPHRYRASWSEKTVWKWIKSDVKKKRILQINYLVYLELTYKLSLSKEIILLWFCILIQMPWFFFHLRLSNHFWIKIMSTYASKYELISWASRILLRVLKNILGRNS